MASPAKTWFPVGEGLVAGEDDGLLFFIALADGLEEKTGVSGFQREISDSSMRSSLGRVRFLISRESRFPPKPWPCGEPVQWRR